MTLREFLVNMNEDLKQEWTHLQFYLYHAAAVKGLHALEYRELLEESAKGELAHVHQFLTRLFGLYFEEPAMTGNTFPRLTHVADILTYAVLLETTVVGNYAKRLQELETLPQENITEATYLKIFYEKQLEDSYEDCEKLRRLLADSGPLQPKRELSVNFGHIPNTAR